MLIEKAKKIALKLNVRDPRLSTGCLHKFKMWHGILSQVVSGESKNASAEKVDEQLKKLPSEID